MDDATTRISSGAFCKTYGIKKKDIKKKDTINSLQSCRWDH